MESCVLIVEDNEDLRALYEYAIKSEGYAVVTAANGQLALQTLDSMNQLPKLIILDLMMPVMDGWEFLKHKAANSKFASIPTVVCTAVKDSIPQGVPFLRKPLDLDALLAIVDEHCTKIKTEVPTVS